MHSIQSLKRFHCVAVLDHLQIFVFPSFLADSFTKILESSSFLRQPEFSQVADLWEDSFPHPILVANILLQEGEKRERGKKMRRKMMRFLIIVVPAVASALQWNKVYPIPALAIANVDVASADLTECIIVSKPGFTDEQKFFVFEQNQWRFFFFFFCWSHQCLLMLTSS